MIEQCNVSKIDGEGNAHRCRKYPSHPGEHRFSMVYCPATKGDCEQACVGSNCNRIEKPFSVEVSDALTEAAKDLPCGHVSPIGPSMLCARPLGHDGMHENFAQKSAWPTDAQNSKWAAEAAQEQARDPIKPDYYHGTAVDDFIAEFKLGFRLGSVIKYVARHEHKDKIQDLKKALWYLSKEIEKLEEK
jgi:hypothetical protein